MPLRTTRSHRPKIVIPVRRVLIIVLVGIAGGFLSLTIIHAVNTISGGGMANVEKIKQNYIAQKNHTGTQGSDRP